MITIKLSTEVQPPLENFFPRRSGVWGNCQFLINQEVESCDYWMVIDGLTRPETTYCQPENIFLFTAEPSSIRRYSQTFLQQFSTVVTCQREIKHPRIIYSPPPLPWFMKLTYDEILERPISKTESLMIISSNKQLTAGHRKRYAFALKLKEYFGDSIELFGRGIRDIEDKWSVQKSYRYAVVIENSRSLDYFSEKITDCFLTETFPFYDGCPNLADYFPDETFQRINIDNFSETVTLIEKILAKPEHYENHRAALRKAKESYLNNYSLFALMSKYALPSSASKQKITLAPEKPHFTWNGWRPKIFSGLRKISRKLRQ